MPRPLVRLAVIAALLGASIDIASAASLGIVANDLDAGSAAVMTCGDPSSTSMSYVGDGAGRVTSVTLSGLPTECSGGDLSATLVGSSGTLATGGPMTVPAGPSVTVAITPNPPATSVVHTELVIAGP